MWFQTKTQKQNKTPKEKKTGGKHRWGQRLGTSDERQHTVKLLVPAPQCMQMLFKLMNLVRAPHFYSQNLFTYSQNFLSLNNIYNIVRHFCGI